MQIPGDYYEQVANAEEMRDEAMQADGEDVVGILEMNLDLMMANMKNRLREMFPHGAPEFMDITMEELQLHNDKNHDYAGGGHPLGNFYRVAEIFSKYPDLNLGDPRVIALVYMMKQVDATLWLLNGKHEAKVEGIQSRLADIHTYAKLIRVIDVYMSR